jgi:uncharacterized membrane protein
MPIGPVQLLVLGFNHPNFQGEILSEIDSLNEKGTIRVIDSLTVFKDKEGDVTILHRSDLSPEEASEFGAVIGALIGLGAAGAEGAIAGAEVGATEMADGVDFFSDEAWDVVEEIPNDSAAALILLEHQWAIPLRDSVIRAGGFPIGTGFISPLDLVAIGVIEAEEAEALADAESKGKGQSTTTPK